MGHREMNPESGARVSKVEEFHVELVPYDPGWAALYDQGAEQVRAILSGLAVDVQHFGSTAVPGLDAKPIVDILVGVPVGAFLTPEQFDALAEHSYEFLGEDGRRPGRIFFRKRDSASFNLSIVPFGSDLWHDNLSIRDYLRTHPVEAGRYASVKREAAAAAPHSLLGYQNRKRCFVEKLRGCARAWAASDGRRS